MGAYILTLTAPATLGLLQAICGELNGRPLLSDSAPRFNGRCRPLPFVPSANVSARVSVTDQYSGVHYLCADPPCVHDQGTTLTA